MHWKKIGLFVCDGKKTEQSDYSILVSVSHLKITERIFVRECRKKTNIDARIERMFIRYECVFCVSNTQRSPWTFFVLFLSFFRSSSKRFSMPINAFFSIHSWFFIAFVIRHCWIWCTHRMRGSVAVSNDTSLKNDLVIWICIACILHSETVNGSRDVERRFLYCVFVFGI